MSRLFYIYDLIFVCGTILYLLPYMFSFLVALRQNNEIEKIERVNMYYTFLFSNMEKNPLWRKKSKNTDVETGKSFCIIFFLLCSLEKCFPEDIIKFKYTLHIHIDLECMNRSEKKNIFCC